MDLAGTFGLALLSFVVTSLAAVPFINLLYRLKFQRQQEVHVLSPIFTKLHAWKVGTPNSGGILIVAVTIILGFLFIQPSLDPRFSPAMIVFLGMISYGLLGLYDDIKKYFGYQKEKFWGMRLRAKLLIQILLALGLGWLIWELQNPVEFITLPTFLFPDLILDQTTYIIFAALTIVATVNAVNITDGVDGLATGLLIMTLLTFLALIYIAEQNFILELPIGTAGLATLIAVWLGSLLAFLYFNINPARVWMGDSGAFAFGSGIAVLSFLIGIPFLLPVIGFVYVVETASSLLQWYSMRWMKHKIFLIAPIHHHFEAASWPETKVTMRFWLAGALASLSGLYIFTRFFGV